jgi:DNA-binding GntR family transcriptional regulator
MDNSNPFARIRLQPSNIRDVAYQALHDAILSAQLRPGERLIEERLAQQLGASRTPLREAIQKLEQEGLVVRLPSGGVMVSRLDPEELVNLYTIRIALEALAAGLAAQQITPQELNAMRLLNDQFQFKREQTDLVSVLVAGREFHRLIWVASRNLKLVEILDGVTSQINRYRMISVVWRPKEALEEHHSIIEALAAGEPDLAELLIRTHVQTERDFTLKKLAALQTEGE